MMPSFLYVSTIQCQFPLYLYVCSLVLTESRGNPKDTENADAINEFIEGRYGFTDGGYSNKMCSFSESFVVSAVFAGPEALLDNSAFGSNRTDDSKDDGIIGYFEAVAAFEKTDV